MHGSKDLFMCIWIKTLSVASARNTTEIPLSRKGIYADVMEKSSSYWLQAWLDLGANFPQKVLSLSSPLSLYFSVLPPFSNMFSSPGENMATNISKLIPF